MEGFYWFEFFGKIDENGENFCSLNLFSPSSPGFRAQLLFIEE
jgi:hypothetical protein